MLTEKPILPTLEELGQEIAWTTRRVRRLRALYRLVRKIGDEARRSESENRAFIERMKDSQEGQDA